MKKHEEVSEDNETERAATPEEELPDIPKHSLLEGKDIL